MSYGNMAIKPCLTNDGSMFFICSYANIAIFFLQMCKEKACNLEPNDREKNLSNASPLETKSLKRGDDCNIIIKCYFYQEDEEKQLFLVC